MDYPPSPGGGPLVFVSPELDRPNTAPFDNRLPLTPNECKYKPEGFWGQFLNPNYLPDDNLLSEALMEAASGKRSLDSIALHSVVVQLREELACMSLRNETLENQTLQIYSSDYIPEYYLPRGEHCKVALGFFSSNWYTILKEYHLLEDFQNALMNIKFGSRLQITKVEFDVDIRPMDLRLKHRICLPPIMPPHLIDSQQFSCIIISLIATK